MATQKKTVEEILTGLFEVRVLPMMGEYVLYCRDKVIGGIYDDRLLVKITPASREMLPCCEEVSPYPGAKPQFFVETREKAFLQALFVAVAESLPAPKKKR